MASVDYYYGQIVEGLLMGEEDWQWAIRLSGGAVIKNWDKRRTIAPALNLRDGFLLAIFSEDETRLQFGSVNSVTEEITVNNEVVFTPTQYSISDPVHVPEETYPQQPDDQEVENLAVAWDAALQERVADGPTGPMPDSEELGDFDDEE